VASVRDQHVAFNPARTPPGHLLSATRRAGSARPPGTDGQSWLRPDTSQQMRRRSSDLSEVGRLFRAKLRHLREQERAGEQQRRRARRQARPHPAPSLIPGQPIPAADTLLSAGEVARLFGVRPKTVSRWADAAGLPSMRTLDGHGRYRWADVQQWLTRGDAATP
jgi:Helix-turn-helix domain